MSDRWVTMKDIPGGVLVYCRACGSKQTFMAVSTNYAEARRAAIAHHWQHSQSAPHAAAVQAYHEPVELSPEEQKLAELFGAPPPSERELRRRAAKTRAREYKTRARE